MCRRLVVRWLLVFSLVLTIGSNDFVLAATTQNSETVVINEGKELKSLLASISKSISAGDIEQVSKKYDSFNKQIILVQGKLAKITDKGKKKNLYNSYVKSSIATKERVMYEVSEFRLLNGLDKYLIAKNEKQINASLEKLSKLKKQATDIKKKKHYSALPKSIRSYLLNWERHVKNRTVPSKYFTGKSVAKLITLPNGSFSRVEANKMVTRILKINYKYLTKLNVKDIEVRLINRKLTDEPEYAYLKGVTPRGWEGTGLTWDDVPGAGGDPTMFRIGYSDRGKGHGGINLELHETAHAIDRYVFSNISETSTFKTIQRKERKAFLPDAYYTYPEEYFAESLAYYYLGKTSRDELKKKAPQTYKFLYNLERK